MHAYLRREDPTLLGLQPHPGDGTNARQLSLWTAKATRAKSNIVLSLGDAAMSKARLFVDSDERTALELWTELERIYTASNAQAIQNLKNRLDALLYVDGKDWNAHVTKFLTIIGELATFDAELSPTDQTSKLLRSLPPSFSPLAMVSDLTEITFDKLVSAVQLEIARRSNPNNPQQGNGQFKAHSTTLTGKRKASVRNRTSRIKKNREAQI